MSRSMGFVLGIISLGAGLFLIGQAVSVSTTWGSWRMGAFSVPSGLVVLPLLVGIAMLFFNHKSKLWKIVTVLGAVFILLAIILSIRITLNRVSLFDFILMFGLTLAGVGLLLRHWFRT